MESFGELVDKIAAHAKLDRQKVERLVAEKQEELSGLVSKEGAAYIVGRELGISLVKEGRRDMKVKNLMSGIRNLDIELKVARVFDVRSWQKAEKKGKVCNLLVGDETGVCRLSLWNDEVAIIESGKVKEGDCVRVSNGYVMSDNRGSPEVRVGQGRMTKIDKEISLAEQGLTEPSVSDARELAGISDGGFFRVRASVVQLFSRRPFYSVCSECEARMAEENGKESCSAHPNALPKYNLVASGFIDDGTACMRAVMFRESAEKILDDKPERIKQAYDSNPEGMLGTASIGREFIFTGKARKSDFSGDIELMVNGIEDVDVKQEAERLARELEAQP